jgi:16S rRNA (cytosine1402-N4)-methyltransferase
VTNFQHKPVMLEEVLEWLRPGPGKYFVDGTLGGGGHAEATLERSGPTGSLFGCDRDGEAVQAAKARLGRFGDRVRIEQGNYSQLREWLEAGVADGVLLDLGVSSPQLDRAERGFSFLRDGPLDMRMDRSSGPTAADLVNQLREEELAKIFWEFGGESQSRRFARAIVHDRKLVRFTSTAQLAGLIERLSPRAGKKSHPATQVFQALRMAVNDELGGLQRGLHAALEILKPRGRLVVITFHSLEDRMVKDFGRDYARDYEVVAEVDVPELRKPRNPLLKVLTRKAVLPSEAAVRENPRSRSAQIRVFEKI